MLLERILQSCCVCSFAHNHQPQMQHLVAKQVALLANMQDLARLANHLLHRLVQFGVKGLISSIYWPDFIGL